MRQTNSIFFSKNQTEVTKHLLKYRHNQNTCVAHFAQYWANDDKPYDTAYLKENFHETIVAKSYVYELLSLLSNEIICKFSYTFVAWQNTIKETVVAVLERLTHLDALCAFRFIEIALKTIEFA